MKRRQFELPWMLVQANSTTAVIVPAGAFIEPVGLKKARGTSEMRGRNGLVEAQLTLQWADVEDTLGSTTTIGTNMNADGYYPPSAGSTDVSTTASQKRLVRPSWTVKLTSGSTTGWAWVGGLIEIVDAG